jgi:hypothetical protein
MNEKGYTLNELIEGSKKLAIQIKSGNYPVGTSPKDFQIYGDFAIYCPYNPLQVIPLSTVSKITTRWDKTGLLDGLDDEFYRDECAASLEKTVQFIINDFKDLVKRVNNLYGNDWFAGIILAVVRLLYNTDGGIPEQAPYVDIRILIGDCVRFCMTNYNLYKNLNNIIALDGEAEFCQLYVKHFVKSYKLNECVKKCC